MILPLYGLHLDAARKLGLSIDEALRACTVTVAQLLVLRHDDERVLAYEIGGDPVAVVICGGVPVRNDLLSESPQRRT